MEVLPAIRWKTYVAAPAERVFAALATADGWDGWFTQGSAMDARVGGELTMRWRDAERTRHRVTLWGAVHEDMVQHCPILAFEPPRRLVFQWQTTDHATTVEFLVMPRGSGSEVVVLDSGYVAGDLDIRGIAGEIGGHSPYVMCACGWAEALTLLKMYVEHGVDYGAVPAPSP